MITIDVMISGYVLKGITDEALKLFLQMQLAGTKTWYTSLILLRFSPSIFPARGWEIDRRSTFFHDSVVNIDEGANNNQSMPSIDSGFHDFMGFSNLVISNLQEFEKVATELGDRKFDDNGFNTLEKKFPSKPRNFWLYPD